jgi:hypothetical protein
MRIRVPQHRRNHRYFTRVQSRLTKLSGVKSVMVNVLSGSILVLHDLGEEELRQYAEENGLFRIASEVVEAIPLSERLTGHFNTLGAIFQNATGGALDLKGVAVLALTAAGGIQLLRKKALPEGTSLLWYASVLLREKKKPRRS